MATRLAILSVLCVPANAWGPLGHEVPAELAQRWLNAQARDMLDELVPGESLADMSTWADRMRSNPNQFWQKTAKPFHYVTVADGSHYDISKAPSKGDAVTALKQFKAILQDPNSSHAEKQLALRFSIHLVGDLHQPLHVGNGKDLGGNKVKVKHRGKTTNLHRLWDSGLIYERGWNRDQWLAHLRKDVSAATLADKDNIDPGIWIEESRALRSLVYSYRSTISDEYIQQAQPVLDQRLQQSSVRIAAYLNHLAR